jgi:hypothetical protein
MTANRLSGQITVGLDRDMAIDRDFDRLRGPDVAKNIEEEFLIDYSVALDIEYLRGLEARIIKAAKKHSLLRDFPVENRELEAFLESCEMNDY